MGLRLLLVKNASIIVLVQFSFVNPLSPHSNSADGIVFLLSNFFLPLVTPPHNHHYHFEKKKSSHEKSKGKKCMNSYHLAPMPLFCDQKERKNQFEFGHPRRCTHRTTVPSPAPDCLSLSVILGQSYFAVTKFQFVFIMPCPEILFLFSIGLPQDARKRRLPLHFLQNRALISSKALLRRHPVPPSTTLSAVFLNRMKILWLFLQPMRKSSLRPDVFGALFGS